MESLDLGGVEDLMGIDDPLDGFEHAEICGSCSFPRVTTLPEFLRPSTQCLVLSLVCATDSATSLIWWGCAQAATEFCASSSRVAS